MAGSDGSMGVTVVERSLMSQDPPVGRSCRVEVSDRFGMSGGGPPSRRPRLGRWPGRAGRVRADIGICPLATSRSCPLTAISSRKVPVAGDTTAMPVPSTGISATPRASHGEKSNIRQQMSFRRRFSPTTSSRIASGTSAGSRTRSVAAMPAPHWFFRFMYDRESAAWERGRDEPEQRELVERTADELANVVAPPGPVADLGCGPGAHALALARRGYDVVGVDGSPRMVEVARTRAARDEVDATFDVHDVSAPLRFADASLGGALAILVLQHLPHPAAFIAEIRRCLRPGGHLLITAPARDEHVAHVPEPVLAAARSVLSPRARRRPLLRHELPARSSRGPGPDRRRVQRRARSRERVGSRVASFAVQQHRIQSRRSVRPTRQPSSTRILLGRGHLRAVAQAGRDRADGRAGARAAAGPASGSGRPAPSRRWRAGGATRCGASGTNWPCGSNAWTRAPITSSRSAGGCRCSPLPAAANPRPCAKRRALRALSQDLDGPDVGAGPPARPGIHHPRRARGRHPGSVPDCPAPARPRRGAGRTRERRSADAGCERCRAAAEGNDGSLHRSRRDGAGAASRSGQGSSDLGRRRDRARMGRSAAVAARGPAPGQHPHRGWHLLWRGRLRRPMRWRSSP